MCIHVKYQNITVDKRLYMFFVFEQTAKTIFFFNFFQLNIMLQIIEYLGSTSISFFCIVPHYYAIIKNIYYPMIRNTIFQVHNCTQPSLALGLVIWTYKENNARFSCNIQPSRCITYRQLILICYIKNQSISIYVSVNDHNII